MSRLIHLNGPPGIGKSTLARRYADSHPGVLDCDIDVLRSLIGGWKEDFAGAGALIRPAALAMIEAYLRNGRDVVLPQMLLDVGEVGRFESAAGSAGAGFVEIVLMDSVDATVERFHRRGESEPGDPWHREVRAQVAAEGGDELLRRSHAALERVVRARPGATVVWSAEGRPDATYRELVTCLDE